MALALAALGSAQTPAAKADSLGRDNPQSSVTGFLEACQNRDYGKASEYLDLRSMTPQNRAQLGPVLAKDLEGILNSDPDFSVLRLSHSSEGDLADDADVNRERIASIEQKGVPVTLEMERTPLSPGGPPVWLFSRDTVQAIPKLAGFVTPPAIARYLPPFFSSVQIVETPL